MHDIVIVKVHGPLPVIEVSAAEAQAGAGPVATAMFDTVGGVQPAGTTSVVCEPALKSLPLGPENVNVNVTPVAGTISVAGDTVIVPSPLEAEPASVNVACAC